MSRQIVCPLHAAARRWPDSIALVTPERAFRFDELDRIVEGSAQRLASITPPRGRIAFFMPNDARLVVLLLAALRKGLVAVPLSTRWPLERLPSLLHTIEAGLVITENEAASSGGRPCALPQTVMGEEAEFAEPMLNLQQPATIIFTSGSTGEPKAALHTLRNHLFSARGANRNIPLETGDRWLLALPLYHVGGIAILFRSLLAGATVVLPDHHQALPDALADHQITHVSLVATQLYRLLDERPRSLDALKAILLGGSAVPPALLDAAYERGLPVHTSYGLTETASQVTATPRGGSPRCFRTAGRVLPHRAVRISPDGEIQIRGGVRFAGYVEGSTLHQPFDPDGWFSTGDLGHFDSGERLVIVGRRDNRIISGGENIQAETVEKAMLQLDGVQEVLVVPVPHAEFGHRPVAFVRGAVALDALPERLASLLPRFMIPDAFYPWPAEVGIGMKPDRQAFTSLAARKTR